MRRTTALVACLACAWLAGCGSSSDGDAAAVRRTIHGALRAALVQHDLRGACGYATVAGRARLLHWYRVSYDRRFRSCEDVLRFEIRLERSALVPTLRRSLGVIGKVHVTGSRATAQVGSSPGAYPDYRSTVLRKVGGRWLIDDSDAIPHGQ
jgi:hypothetical protein